jgi:branched-chain amino acid transport system substrate-binding protein
MAKEVGVGLILALAVVASGCNNNNNKPTGSGPSASGSTTSASTASPTDTIKLGQTMAYSGPASAYAVIGKTEAAYFKMQNDKGGVNGHKIEFLSYDDAYNPAKTVEQTRKLVEQDNILVNFNSLGTATQSAVHSYLNDRKIPQIFVASGGDKWADPKFPWTVGYQPSYQVEAKVFGKYIKETKPNAKACLLYQNDDFGKDYVIGLKAIFADQYDKTFVKAVSYETSDPTVDSQIVTLQSSGCDTAVLAASPKFAAQAIRKIFDIGWKPTTLMSNVSASVTSVMKVAGLEKGTGVMIGAYLKDPSDPKMKDDPGLAEFREFMKKYQPDLDATDSNAVYGFGVSRTMVKVLEQCGSDFSRENIMKQTLSLKDLQLGTAIDGIKINTSPDHLRPFTQMQLAKFNGTSWEVFGNILNAE